MPRSFPRLLLPAMLMAATAAILPPYATSHASISGQESSSSALSGIDDSTYTYDSTIATTNVNTYTQQYEDTITQIAITDADIATIQAHINTQGASDDETRALKFRSAYFKLVDKAADLRNKARALDTLISSQKLNDSSSNGQILSDADYNTLRARLEAVEAQAKANRTELQSMEDRLNSGDPTASLNQYDYLYKESIRLSDMAHSLREILNNSVYPDGTPSVGSSTSGGISTGSSGSSDDSGSSGSGSSMMDALKSGAIQGIAQSLFSNGGLGNALGGQGAVAGSTASVAKPVAKAPKPDTTPATDDKTCDDSGAKAAAAKAALPERDDSGKIIKSTGAATTDTAPGKAADDVIANPAGSKKPACVGVDYTKKNPGGTDATAAHGSKITSLADMQAQIAAMNGQCVSDSKSSAANSCECPALVKANSNLGPTSGWTKGNQVWGDTSLAIGTPISTFCKGSDSYVNGNAAYGCSHTGLYAGQDADNLYVYNQFNNSNGPKISKIPKNAWNGHSEEGGVKFYTIANGDAFLFGIPYYVQYTLRALSVWPEGEGLAKADNHAYNVL